MLAVIRPDWKVDRQADWDQISKLVSCDLFQMLLAARIGSVRRVLVLILSAELNIRNVLQPWK